MPSCTSTYRLDRLDTKSDPGHLLGRYKGPRSVPRLWACCCGTNDVITRKSRTCNRAHEIVISISADAEAALCCNITHERRMYNKMQDLNKADAASITVLSRPASFLKNEYRVSPSECSDINLWNVGAHQSKSKMTNARHPTKTAPAPSEVFPQMSLHYEHHFSPFYRSLCLLLFCGNQVVRNSIFLAPSLGTEPTSDG